MIKVKCVKIFGTDQNSKLCQNLGDGGSRYHQNYIRIIDRLSYCHNCNTKVIKTCAHTNLSNDKSLAR